jgi:hypothetical protein
MERIHKFMVIVSTDGDGFDEKHFRVSLSDYIQLMINEGDATPYDYDVDALVTSYSVQHDSST